MTDQHTADLAPLRAVLKVEPSPVIATTLSDAQVIALADLMRSAQARQQQQLATALDHALDHLPRILRGTVRGILFP